MRNVYALSMDVFAMILAVFMIVAALGATIAIGVMAGTLWGALLFAALLWAIYRAFTHQSGPTRPMSRRTVSAFQEPLADD